MFLYYVNNHYFVPVIKIQELLSENDFRKFDPSLIHESVKTGQIDLVSLLLDNSFFYLEFSIYLQDQYGKEVIDYALEKGLL